VLDELVASALSILIYLIVFLFSALDQTILGVVLSHSNSLMCSLLHLMFVRRALKHIIAGQDYLFVSQLLVKHSSNARFIQDKFSALAQIGLAGDIGYVYCHFLHEHASADNIAQHEGNNNKLSDQFAFCIKR
jgi:hypothetical protein